MQISKTNWNMTSSQSTKIPKTYVHFRDFITHFETSQFIDTAFAPIFTMSDFSKIKKPPSFALARAKDGGLLFKELFYKPTYESAGNCFCAFNNPFCSKIMQKCHAKNHRQNRKQAVICPIRHVKVRAKYAYNRYMYQVD